MRAWCWLVPLVVGCLAGAAGAQGEEVEAPAPADTKAPALDMGEEVVVQADTIESPDGGRTYILTGCPVVITQGTTRLSANRITYDRETGDARAEGQILLEQGTRELRADDVIYNLETREGSAHNIRTVAEESIITARELRIYPDRWIATRANVTSCTSDPPHWNITGQTVELILDQRWTARHAGFDFFGFRLGTVREIGHPLKTSREGQRQAELVRQFMPTFGIDRRDGFFAEKDLDILSSKKLAADLQAKLSVKRFFTGGIEASTGGQFKIVGALGYRQDAPNQRARYLEVSRVPELGIVYGERQTAESGRFLPTQVGHLGVPRAATNPDEWRFGAQLGEGLFLQRKGEGSRLPDNVNRDGTRTVLAGTAVRPRLDLGPVQFERLRALLRQSFYGSGEAYTVGGWGIGKDWKLGHLKLGIDHFENYTGGESPFLFDKVEIRTEWRPRAELKLGSWDASWIGRYDQGRGGFYDQLYQLSKKIDCMAFRAGYEVRRSQFTFDIRLLGLEPGFDEEAARPDDTDAADSTDAQDTGQPNEPARRGGRSRRR